MLPLHCLQFTTSTELPGQVQIAGRIMRSVGLTVSLGLGHDKPFHHAVEEARIRIGRALWQDAYGELQSAAQVLYGVAEDVCPSYLPAHDRLMDLLHSLQLKMEFPGLPPVPSTLRTELPRINLS